jgi:hypothetical protein
VQSVLALPVLALVELSTIGDAQFASHAPPLLGYVVRRATSGVGIEWCDFAPHSLAQWYELPGQAGPRRERHAVNRVALRKPTEPTRRS